ncbi:hypothetical protein [Paucibacter sp. Y2R2-4]|uniref:hypothetical protein n=1 Tax=Paucibacter sp. Y2R2-4 TaxID=2893553 RepID=UPI0021E3A9F3|nr:hypothetical protein [Paucibacter sp. Y2R2-4]MCV2351411.1 hypothetical protein [Paucibacter sp. Y2R2-4]
MSEANVASLPPLTRVVSSEGSRLDRADPGTMSTAAGRVTEANSSKLDRLLIASNRHLRN